MKKYLERIFNKKLKLIRSRKTLVIVSIIIVVMVAFGVTYKLHIRNSGSLAVCDDQIITKATDAFLSNSVASLEPDVAKTMQSKNYDKDVNCSYIISTYYVFMSDAKSAKTHFGNLESIEGGEPKVDERLIASAGSLQILRAKIEFLQGQEKQFLENIIPSERIDQ